MPWRITPERVAEEAGSALAALLQDALRSVVLYGEWARPGPRAHRADVHLVAVAEPLTFAHLQRAAQWWARWHRHGVATPLLLSATDLARSRDVFPLEFLEIRAQHRTLAGADLFADLAVGAACVRAQCEREAKGKLLRLRALYLELSGSTRALRALMLDSRRTFLLVMRGLLYLCGEPWRGDERDVLDAFERRYGCQLPVLATMAAAPAEAAIEQRFADYLAEIELLATIADQATARP